MLMLLCQPLVKNKIKVKVNRINCKSKMNIKTDIEKIKKINKINEKGKHYQIKINSLQ